MARKLVIQNLQLKEFRNYHDLNLDFDHGVISIVGPNGIGKTNILEAISLLVPGRGIRAVKFVELDNNLQDSQFKINWHLSANIESKRGCKFIELTRSQFDEEGRCEKIIKIDGEILKNKSNLGYYISMVWLVPQMDFIFISSAGERRRFLDNIVDDFFPTHSTNVNQFEHLMRERMKILRESGGGYDRIWLAGVEHSMSQLSTAITSARLDTLSQLNSSMEDIHCSFLRAQMKLNGFMEEILLANNSLFAEEKYREKLEANREIDANTSRTNHGPHLSDLEVINLANGVVASACSTGEQKSLLISVKFAEVIAKQRWHGIFPIVLLDDIVSHLDTRRRSAMLESLCGLDVQAFISCTSSEELGPIASKFQSIQLQGLTID